MRQSAKHLLPAPGAVHVLRVQCHGGRRAVADHAVDGGGVERRLEARLHLEATHADDLRDLAAFVQPAEEGVQRARRVLTVTGFTPRSRCA